MHDCVNGFHWRQRLYALPPAAFRALMGELERWDLQGEFPMLTRLVGTRDKHYLDLEALSAQRLLEEAVEARADKFLPPGEAFSPAGVKKIEHCPTDDDDAGWSKVMRTLREAHGFRNTWVRKRTAWQPHGVRYLTSEGARYLIEQDSESRACQDAPWLANETSFHRFPLDDAVKLPELGGRTWRELRAMEWTNCDGDGISREALKDTVLGPAWPWDNAPEAEGMADGDTLSVLFRYRCVQLRKGFPEELNGRTLPLLPAPNSRLHDFVQWASDNWLRQSASSRPGRVVFTDGGLSPYPVNVKHLQGLLTQRTAQRDRYKRNAEELTGELAEVRKRLCTAEAQVDRHEQRCDVRARNIRWVGPRTPTTSRATAPPTSRATCASCACSASAAISRCGRATAWWSTTRSRTPPTRSASWRSTSSRNCRRRASTSPATLPRPREAATPAIETRGRSRASRRTTRATVATTSSRRPPAPRPPTSAPPLRFHRARQAAAGHLLHRVGSVSSNERRECVSACVANGLCFLPPVSANMASFRQINEGLRNYLYGPLQPSNPGPASTRSPRLPLGPDAPIPPGRRPIPNSSEQNKKTNVQIPCARMAPVPIAEGEIVCVQHAPSYLKRKAGTPGHESQKTVQVYTLEQANASLRRTRGAATPPRRSRSSTPTRSRGPRARAPPPRPGATASASTASSTTRSTTACCNRRTSATTSRTSASSTSRCRAPAA